MRVQRLVHPRDLSPIHILAEQMRIYKGVREHHRLHSHAQLLHRSHTAEVRVASRKRRHFRVLLHHQDNEAVQADEALLRAEDPHTDVQGVRQGADAARLLPGARHRHIRQFGVLCREDTGKSTQRLQQHTPGSMVGSGHHDHRGLWGYGTQDLRWDVRWGTLCTCWSKFAKIFNFIKLFSYH